SFRRKLWADATVPAHPVRRKRSTVMSGDRLPRNRRTRPMNRPALHAAVVAALPLVVAFNAYNVSAQASSASAQEMITRYARAERMLTWNTGPLLSNDVISVTWLADSSRFWYLVSRPAGR